MRLFACCPGLRWQIVKTIFKEINKADQESLRIQFQKSTGLADAARVCQPSVWKLASVHEIRTTLNTVPFSTSQINIYWRPKEEGKVGMATSVKRASDPTRNQSINLWFLSCLIKKVCMWLIVNFWEYRRPHEVYSPPPEWKVPTMVCHLQNLTQGTGSRTDSTLRGDRGKLLWNEKGVGGWHHLKTLVILQMIYCQVKSHSCPKEWQQCDCKESKVHHIKLLFKILGKMLWLSYLIEKNW